MKAEWNRRRPGFSLVELLAVVAIILILLSLLVPIMGLMRKRGDTTKCLANLRQIMLGTNVYTSDHDGFYPSPWRWVWSDAAAVEWAQADTIPRGTMWTGKYITNPAVYLCTTFAQVYNANPAVAHLTPYVGYSMNEFMASEENLGGTSWAGRTKLKRAQIEKPGELGVFGDEGTVFLPWSRYIINNLCIGVGDNRNAGSYVDALGAFHNMPGNDPTKGKANVAFADGHADLRESKDSKDIFTPFQYK